MIVFYIYKFIFCSLYLHAVSRSRKNTFTQSNTLILKLCDILSRIKKKKFVKLFIKIFTYWNIIFCHKMIWKRVWEYIDHSFFLLRKSLLPCFWNICNRKKKISFVFSFCVDFGKIKGCCYFACQHVHEIYRFF